MNPAPTVAVAAKLACLDIYDPITYSSFDQVIRVNETVCGLRRDGGLLRVVLQGTENAPGWEADFNAIPFEHSILGTLHLGFYHNLPEVLDQLWPLLHVYYAMPNPVLAIEVSGHSKGAAEGAILAALLHNAGYKVTTFLFACPNAGYHKLADYLAKYVPGTSFRNCHTFFREVGDPVPLVPIVPYVAPYPHTLICVPPANDNPLIDILDIEWHSGKLYYQAFADASH